MCEAGDFVGADGESLPVDDGVGGVGDGEGVAAGGEAGLAVDDGGADRVGLGSLDGEDKQQRSADRLETKALRFEM